MTGIKYFLNSNQQDVLRWVSQECPDGVYHGYAHRVTARALHNKGLLSVKGHGESWSATLTKDGIAYLNSDKNPSSDNTQDTEPSQKRQRKTPSTQPPKKNHNGEAKASPPLSTKKRPGVVDQLIAALHDAENHCITIPHEQIRRYQSRAITAEREGKIPYGMQIIIRDQKNNETALVTLEPLPSWRTKVLDPIAVPSHVNDPTDVTQKLSESTTFPVNGPPRERALRLVEALVNAARGRDMKVRPFINQLVEQNASRSRKVRKDGIEITADQDTFRLWFTQEIIRTPHEPTSREVAQARYGYLFPDFDEIPDNNLGLVLERKGQTFWAGAWKDTEDHQLEDDLAQILEEIQLRHEDLIEQRHKEQQRFELQERKHNEEREQARLKFQQDFLIKSMNHQAQQWQQADLLQRYAKAIRDHAAFLKEDERTQALAWADQIEKQSNVCNPLRKTVKTPELPTPSYADLQIFLPQGRRPSWN